ncbi:hypothetical protein [Loigolactobacillus bifermentans]|uniref:Uncharacterized protein n=1 Tax=Loigolactobacillus bifermentans DSM 20003 TaxID=1423726 RepID=A0A0R1GRJ9_9LACO|nr:hypothetical protein [Loigolactobacillus bifermentans]KRK34388.1 hypothetical protein FC07_GL000596 [Loigolactobacillus bifermentans DSM 20003]QGG60092.1 hypothetical protein LB003_06305 [Loigolactobacillus bifermentans]
MELAECMQYLQHHVKATLKDGTIKHWWLLDYEEDIVGDDNPEFNGKDLIIYWTGSSKAPDGSVVMGGNGYPVDWIKSLEIEDDRE